MRRVDLFLVAPVVLVNAAVADDTSVPAGDASPGWWKEVQEDIAASAQRVTWQPQTALADVSAAWRAPNRTPGFRTYFVERGIRVVSRGAEGPSWEWRLSLIVDGRAGTV